MARDTLNKKIERLGAQEFHFADAFVGASVALVAVMFWIMFLTEPKVTEDRLQQKIDFVESQIEWLQEQNLDRIGDIGDTNRRIRSVDNDVTKLEQDIKSYDNQLKAEANRDQFFSMIDKLLEQGRNVDK